MIAVKGQYLAVESVVTVGTGLVIAIATVGAFIAYQEDVISESEVNQEKLVKTRIIEGFNILRNVERGQKEVELPQELGGNSYTVTAGPEIKIITDSGEEYSAGLEHMEDYEFQGSVSGGTINIFKTGNQFRLEES